MNDPNRDAGAPIFTASRDGACDDVQLLHRIDQGDEDAMAAFYREHGRVVLGQVLLAPHTAAGLDQQAHRDTTARQAGRRQQIKNVVRGTSSVPSHSHFRDRLGQEARRSLPRVAFTCPADGVKPEPGSRGG